MASNSFDRRPESNGLGIASFILSLVGVLFTCGTLNLLSLPMSLIALIWRPRGFAIAGTIVSLVGTGLFAGMGYGLIFGIQKISEAQGRQTTQNTLKEAEVAIEQYRDQNNMLPDGIEGNKLVVVFKDAWGTELKYESSGNKYFIRSAGADKKFDTADDMKSTEREFADELNIDFGPGGVEGGPVMIPEDAPTTDDSPTTDDEAKTDTTTIDASSTEGTIKGSDDDGDSE